MIRICKQCGQSFELSDSEIASFNRRGLELPKRCAACRRKNPERKYAEEEVPFWKQDVQDTEQNHFLKSFIIMIAVIVCIAAGGTVFAITRLKPETKQMPDSSTTLLVTETTEPVTAATEPVTAATELVTAATEPVTAATEPVTAATEPVPAATAPPAKEVTYYLNVYRMKFHRPDCNSVKQMNWKSRRKFYGTREEAIAQGYQPCKNCNP